MKTLYLCGPMADCSDEQANAWRDLAVACLHKHYKILNPMIRDFREGYERSQHEKFIVEGDKADIDASDYILAYPWKSSTGTSMEIIYAWTRHKKVVVINAGRKNGEHVRALSPWISYHSHHVADSITDACAWLIEQAEHSEDADAIAAHGGTA